MISAFRESSTVVAAELRRAVPHACREILDLHAGVVVVELARDIPAGPLEQRRDSVAERGLPAVTDVQRASWIRGHELDVHWLAVAGVASPKFSFGGNDLANALRR